MFENLHKISLISIEKAPVTQPNIYSLAFNVIARWKYERFEKLNIPFFYLSKLKTPNFKLSYFRCDYTRNLWNVRYSELLDKGKL